METHLTHESDKRQKIYEVLKKGPTTAAKLEKAANLDDGEAVLKAWQTQRAWVTSDPKGNTVEWSLTDAGRSYFAPRYD